MRVGSLFSGIGGFDLGFEQARMTCLWQVEINVFCQQLLTTHFLNTEKFYDVTQCGKHNLQAVDLICGGFPCQDLSIAGHRKGLAGERSGFWFEMLRILAELCPAWVVIENVPGLFSSHEGRDFAVLLSGLVECGYRVAWRVLDTQGFGLAQRRKRVFLVGHLGDGRAAEVLFESQSLPGNSSAGKKTEEDTTRIIGTIAASGDGGHVSINKTAPLRANSGGSVPCIPSIRLAQTSSNGWGIKLDGTTGTLDSSGGDAVMVPVQDKGYCLNAKRGNQGGGSETLSIHYPKYGVRRLTPVECERLQGFPDGWTEGFSDSVRYRMLGNAVAVTVAKWLGHHLVKAHKKTGEGCITSLARPGDRS